MVCWTTSRVVPAIGVTMASSAPANALRSELLPAFGCPAITTRMPSRNKAPCWVCAITRDRFSCKRVSCPCASACCKKSRSSSGKSKVASTSMRRWINASRNRCISFEKAPAKDRLAPRAAASVLASIKSATASACAKSSLWFKKARCVNSPGCAKRRSANKGLWLSLREVATCKQRATISCNTTGPPWACSSNTSSPV